MVTQGRLASTTLARASIEYFRVYGNYLNACGLFNYVLLFLERVNVNISNSQVVHWQKSLLWTDPPCPPGLCLLSLYSLCFVSLVPSRVFPRNVYPYLPVIESLPYLSLYFINEKVNNICIYYLVVSLVKLFT